jgi:DNA polymerase-3 subunit epsilon
LYLERNTEKIMKDFAAIDFETANEYRSSVCSVGVVIVRNGVMTDNFYSLIKPEPNYYRWFCREVHGLGHEDTDSAEVFPKVWARVEPMIKGLPLVAHNKQFDEGCLREVMEVYQMDWPDYEFYCTLDASRKNSTVWRIISCTRCLQLVDTTWNTTTLWLMQRLVLPLQLNLDFDKICE